jgi:hypothetical protein
MDEPRITRIYADFLLPTQIILCLFPIRVIREIRGYFKFAESA